MISVIIPTFNRKETLGRAVESVLCQTYSDIELIVVDDGSTDDSQALVKESYCGIKYIYQKNQGVSAARNVGISHANGEWIAFLDSDDEWLPNKLEKQMGLLNSQPDYLVCHTEEIWIRNGVRVNQMKKHKKHGGWIFPYCLPLCLMSPSSIVIHRRVFNEVGLFDESLFACEDYDLWLRITARYPVLFHQTPLILKYGGHSDQLSRQFWGMDRFRIEALQKIILSKVLTNEYRCQAVAMLLKKSQILLQGAIKREKKAEIKKYTEIIERFNEYE